MGKTQLHMQFNRLIAESESSASPPLLKVEAIKRTRIPSSKYPAESMVLVSTGEVSPQATVRPLRSWRAWFSALCGSLGCAISGRQDIGVRLHLDLDAADIF
jgi:hypothetical protein